MTVIAEQVEGFQVRTEDLDGGHVLIGDEPESIGGTNVGPSPFVLIQMSLAN